MRKASEREQLKIYCAPAAFCQAMALCIASQTFPFYEYWNVREKNSAGGFFQTNNYWSSTENNANNAWNVNFNNGNVNNDNKNNANYVRCVR